MSRQGERIARRLMRRHGFRFLVDPCNFCILCDREAVQGNARGGWGVMQWRLGQEFEPGVLPQAACGPFLGGLEIGSDHGAAEVLRWPHWDVSYRHDGGMYWFIDPQPTQDETDWSEWRCNLRK